MSWREQIEAQIAALNSLTPEYPDGDGFYGELYGTDAADVYDAARSMQSLLDVAVAAEWFSFHTPQGHVFGLTQKTKYEQMREALDKLREVSDE